jgi:formylglycine-generating enzyme required for sulfatase activity
MLGNVYEFCWDRTPGTYPSDIENPMGSSSGDSRMARGGYFDSSETTSASRTTGVPPYRRYQYGTEGFRLSRPYIEIDTNV